MKKLIFLFISIFILIIDNCFSQTSNQVTSYPAGTGVYSCTSYTPNGLNCSSLSPTGPTILTPNVGIGSANPSQALDVNGTVRAQAFVATNSAALNTFAGNVTIGTTSSYDSNSPLTVQGSNTTELSINSMPANLGCDSFTYLLLHFDGSNGQTTTTDSNCATTPHTLTATNVTLSTSTKQFGTASSSFVGTGAVKSYWDVAGASNLSFGGGNFTIKKWVYFTAVSPATEMIIDKADPLGSGHYEYQVYLMSGTSLDFFYTTDGSTPIVATFAWTPSLNTWYYVELDRSGSNLYAFIGQPNGVTSQIGTTYNIGASVIHNDSGDLWIGDGTTNASFGSSYYLDDTAIDIGIARNTAAGFAVPTQAFASNAGVPTLTLGDNGLNISQISSSSSTKSMSIINNGITSETIDQNGNVGIGTINPGKALDVWGTIDNVRFVGIGTTTPQELCRKSDGTVGYFNGSWSGTCN